MVEPTRPSGVRGLRGRGPAMLCAATVLASIGAATLTLGSAASAVEQTPLEACSPVAREASSQARQINIVVDDSGSMFFNGKSEEKRWSFAKYSLEVLAALMGSEDTMNVFLLSDIEAGTAPAPVVTLSGSDSAASRVAQVHDVQFRGGGTPYARVQQAFDDVKTSSAEEKWLVILTDGQFQKGSEPSLIDVSVDEVARDLKAFVGDTTGLKVAYLALGDSKEIAGDRAAGIFTDKAATSRDLLGKMASFSNLIFGRDDAADVPTTWSVDLPLDSMIVLSQGRGVEPVTVSAAGTDLEPAAASEAYVQWAPNQQAVWDDRLVAAVPNRNLEGVLAQYRDIPSGDLSFGNLPAEANLTVFYEPKVNLGYRLEDSSGSVVTQADLVPGDYVLQYGFMDDECQFTDSALLGTVEYSAQVFEDGTTVTDGLQPGETITLNEGDAEIAMQASYLEGATAAQTFPLTVLPFPMQGSLVAEGATYNVSELAEFPPATSGTQLLYSIIEDGAERPPSAEEWAALDSETITITHDSNLEFDLVKGEEPGAFTLLLRAPDGDVYAADTGTFDVTVQAPTNSNGIAGTSATTTVDVRDDISGLDRFMNWLKTAGWKWFLALLAIIIALGYVFKKRFPKEIKGSPTIVGDAQSIGLPQQTSKGKFTRSGRRYLPFLADTATLRYVPPGVSGFRPMKLKAVGSKQMSVTNWKSLAERANVEVGGRAFDESMRQAPRFGARTSVRATGEGMTYTLTPNQ